MQRSFKQTSTQKGQDFHATGTLPHNKSLLETPGTVKDKFQYLQNLAEDLCKTVEDEIVYLKDFSHSLSEKIQEEEQKPKQAVKEVISKMNKFQEQINKHFEHQAAENDKFQKEITDLKGDKTSIEQALIETTEWLNYLEAKIGVVIPRDNHLMTGNTN